MSDDIAKGFTRISGKRSPPGDGAKYYVQFRGGHIDWNTAYTAEQLVWKHGDKPSAWDVVAVQRA